MALYATRTTYDSTGSEVYTLAADGPVSVFGVTVDITSVNPGLVVVVGKNINGEVITFNGAIAIGTTEYIRGLVEITSMTLKGSGGDAIMSYWPAVA